MSLHDRFNEQYNAIEKNTSLQKTNHRAWQNTKGIALQKEIILQRDAHRHEHLRISQNRRKTDQAINPV